MLFISPSESAKLPGILAALVTRAGGEVFSEDQ